MATAHDTCSHDWDHASKSRCRRARQKAERLRAEQVDAVVEYFDNDGGIADWLSRGARRFAMDRCVARDIPTADRRALAASLLDYFNPTLDEAGLARRKADGYTVTASPSEIRRIVLRSFS